MAFYSNWFSSSTPVVSGPVAPTQAQIGAAQDAVIAAQKAYDELVAQAKAAQAYNQVQKV